MMSVCAGPDERDQYSLPADGADYVKAIGGQIKGLRVAYTDDLGYVEALDPEVRAACAKAVKAFRELGCRVETVNPGWPSPMDYFEQIFCGGLAIRLAPYLAERRGEIDAGLLPLVERALAQGPTRYVQAWFDRLAWWAYPRGLFEKYDLLVTPTVACPPFAPDLDTPPDVAGKRVSFYGWLPYTFPFNMTGQPAASVPCGFTRDGLPIGLQIVGRRYADVTVLRACAAFEHARPWAAKHPPIES
jgi:aspartyl-tRNA(Asn)/glutamyl-tRNA(Gln) amidotransferase subunit A